MSNLTEKMMPAEKAALLQLVSKKKINKGHSHKEQYTIHNDWTYYKEKGIELVFFDSGVSAVLQ